jgi:hypothetical protein
MRNLLRCRRGSVAFATVIALVPLIGAVALGAEAGSWYVIKQHAQNAADAAAYSGALRVACDSSGSTTCDKAQDYVYRGKQFADQNKFCDPRDTSYPCASSPPIGTTRTVGIDQPTSTTVRAVVSQTQPAYLAAVLGLSTVNIPATAVAEVKRLANPCALSLTDPIAFQGSTVVQAQNCGLSSNSTQSNSLNFTGNGLDVSKAGAISGQGDCKDNGGGQCSKAITFAPPVPDPLSGLNSAMSTLSAASFTAACGSTLTAYSATQKCYNNIGNGKNDFKFGNAIYNLNGVYFFNGNVSIGGSTTLKLACSPPTCGATLILLPGSTLTINGGAIIQLTGSDTVSPSQVPTALASVVNLMSKLLIYDPEATSGNQTLKIQGNSSSYFNGITYAPKADVLYQGSTQSYTCVEVIAKGITFSGASNFDNSGCSESTKIVSQYVQLVQ